MSTSVSFAEGLRAHLSGIAELADSQIRRLYAHYELMCRWNARLNLTTVTELEAAVVRHYCESVFVGVYIRRGSVVDVGSGAGFPGIPIAVVCPESRVTLVESHRRKAVFLREATRDLANVNVLDCRAEFVKGHYDWLVSRAVDPVSVLRLRIADRFAILTGAGDADRAPDAKVIHLLWGEKRVLLIGDL